MRPTTRLGKALPAADARHGLIRTADLTAEGLEPRQIRDLVADGVIERIVRGLYRLPGSRTPLQDVAAAVMRHGAAVASHRSALFVHGLDVAPPDPPHITLPPGSTSGTTLGVLHRSPLERADRTRRQGIPVTTLARSIVDAAEVSPVEGLATVVNEAISRRMVRLADILAAADRVEQAPGRTGSGRLRSVLSAWTESIQPDSITEAATIRRIRTFGIPAPVTQHEVFDATGAFVARLDLAWPEQMVAREYDSIRHHGPDRTDADELRLQKLEALGWSVDPLYRYHLLPSETAWLHVLQRQLRAAGLAAS